MEIRTSPVAALAACALLVVLAACKDKSTQSGADVSPPARVVNLEATSGDDDLATLTWTAPGDDGSTGRVSRYEFRYSTKPVTSTSWPNMTHLDVSPAPKNGGEPETLGVEGTGARYWYFLMRSVDESANWSPASNVAAARLSDRTPPRTVTDLEVASTTAQSVTLRWTAPGDDGTVGRAARYEIFYAESAIPPDTWTELPPEGLPDPVPAGTIQQFEVGGLLRGHSYYFCLRAADEFSNRGVLSNMVPGVPGLRRLTTSPGLSRFGARFAAWSPDGSQVLFTGDWDEAENLDVYSIPSVGGVAVRLTSDPAADSHARWSPDGRTIAFTSDRGGKDDIWLMDATPGAQSYLFTVHAAGASQPTWLPAGRYLAFVLRGAGSHFTTICADTIGGGRQWTLLDDPSENLDPAWSPDSEHIAFTSDRNGDQNIWTMQIWDVVAVRRTFSDGVDAAPSWSPDQERIAFHSDRAGSLDIWTMSAIGVQFEQITFDPTADTYPAWSPDGRRIAFASRRTGQSEIWVQDLW